MKAANVENADLVQLTAFKVGAEEYVVDIMRVREIIRPIPVTRVRKGPRFVEGVINLRGEVIPVVDLRRRFELPVEDHAQRKIVIITIEGRVIGLIVDAVTEVVRVPRSAIRPAPGLLDAHQAPYFLGVCHFRGRTLLLLNVKNIIASDEAIDVAAAAQFLRGDA
jgi:purine-binding chemotaxis protein CheW